ncbi:hypothetical protein [Roseomonas indoligenes]|uniref:Uncharacterized protein n=1 Tax=Roseomonas indoligenes TaxID=2820811 RepID=A0A940S8G4_9PROT|nr:hypothetical protein [Pararoseomonas indoligenes]MBP0494082.1 hypothetical protein [Pararoseomonas indoligenes]
MRRRRLALLLATLPLTAAGPAELDLARDYVVRYRATLPDLRRLALGAAAGGNVPGSAEVQAAIDADLTTAEPAYREAMALALAEGLPPDALRRALADGSIRAEIAASPDAIRLSSTLNRLTFEAVAGMAERAMKPR